MSITMLRKVNNSPQSIRDPNYLLAVVHKAITPETVDSKRCRFDMFVRLSPGQPSFNTRKGPQRTWCFRGDKYTDQEFKMLRNLLNMIKKNMHKWDRVELYDNSKKIEERIVVKILDGVVDDNQLNQYSLMLLNYPLPEYLK